MKMKKGFLLLRDGFIGAIIGIAITIAICSAIAFGIRVVKDNKIANRYDRVFFNFHLYIM